MINNNRGWVSHGLPAVTQAAILKNRLFLAKGTKVWFNFQK
jgi:hypothetical protein